MEGWGKSLDGRMRVAGVEAGVVEINDLHAIQLGNMGIFLEKNWETADRLGFANLIPILFIYRGQQMEYSGAVGINPGGLRDRGANP